MAGPGGDVRTMSPQETAQWCNSLALCGVKGRILRDLQEQIQKRQIDGLQFDGMLRTNTLTDLGIEELNARLALSIRRSWTTDFNGVTFITWAASQAHFQSRDEDPRRHKRDFFSQADGPDSEYSRASYGMPPRSRDMPWSPSMAHGVPPLRDPQLSMERVGRDPRLEDPGYLGMDHRVPSPYPGDRGMGYDDFYDRGAGQMPADRRAAWRGSPPRLDGMDPWGRGPQIQIPPSPPGSRDMYGGYHDPYDPGCPDDFYDQPPSHRRDEPGRFGYPDRGPAYSPEAFDERHERAMRRSPGNGNAWSGMGLDQALPKRGPVPNNVARLYDIPSGPVQKPRSPQAPQAYEENDYEPPQPAVPSKGGRANVRDPNAGEWGGLFGEEPALPPKRPQRRESREPEEVAQGTSPGMWRGDLFEEGRQKVPPMPRPGHHPHDNGGRASRPGPSAQDEGFQEMGECDDADDFDEQEVGFKEPAPAAARPAPRARRQTPPVDDGWGGQSLGDALAHKQATPSGGSTATGAGGSSSSSVRSGGQKSIPSGAGSADPGKSPEWIMNWVRSLPESHVPERTREHLADLIAESQMDGRFFSDYVQKVPPEVCAPKHAMKLKAAWSNVLKEAEVAEMAAACAVRPTQKGMLVAV
ncbi:unnamed protein product [Durusdinium trenchii]|uniref:SAM domain-containing protein n=1 Tax=Durusdinium trenchii TaxID=1381693 RepID=A0ABP0PBX8_9DINO